MSFLSLFFASLLGSPHCAAMCGGFALVACSGEQQRTATLFAYNIGRLITYVLLGAIAGYLGHNLDVAGAQWGVGRFSALLLGILLVLYGLGQLFLLKPTARFWISGPIHRLYQQAVRLLPSLKFPRTRALLIGFLSTLLPCGWLYSFATLAATRADPLQSSFVMFCFWLGTIPIMLSIGAALQNLLKRWGQEARALSVGFLIVAGMLSIAAHFGVGISAHNGPADHAHDPTHSTLFELFWPTRTDHVDTNSAGMAEAVCAPPSSLAEIAGARPEKPTN